MDLFVFLTAFILAALSAVVAEAAADAKLERAPNVVIFFVDDMGYGDISANGNDTLKTPSIDQLATDGVRFSQWISGDPMCTPSRAALMTGRLPVRLGMTSSDGRFRVLNSPGLPGGLPPGELTMGEALRERGYRTGAVGKWHLGIGEGGRLLPTGHGFDSFYGMGCTNTLACGVRWRRWCRSRVSAARSVSLPPYSTSQSKGSTTHPHLASPSLFKTYDCTPPTRADRVSSSGSTAPSTSSSRRQDTSGSAYS